MRGWWIGVGVLSVCGVLSAASSGCVDTADGERGTYGSPCFGSFGDVLRCGRESGGADPQGQDPGEIEDDCVVVCDILVSCFGFDPGECVPECRADPLPPQIVECIKQQQCNSNLCFPGS